MTIFAHKLWNPVSANPSAKPSVPVNKSIFLKSKLKGIALRYAIFKNENTDIDVFDAAICSYEYGYRYDFIYKTLLEYYQ